MANTKSSRTKLPEPFSIDTWRPGEYRLRLYFDGPKFRPAVVEEVYHDVERLIANAARIYTDDSCPELKFDELMAKGRAKFAYMLHYRYLVSTSTRFNFFKCFKAAVANLFRSEVQRYRFTQKRTGVKPPPRGEIWCGQARPKTIEICADDPENHIQIPDRPDPAGEREMRELTDDFKSQLDPIECCVLDQMLEPNLMSLAYAWNQAHRGSKPGAPVRVRITEEALAYGLAYGKESEERKFPLSLFQKTVLSIQRKYARFKTMSSEQEQANIRYNVVLAQLAKVFNLQMPPVEDIVIRRMLTIAARKNIDKVDPQVAQMLEEVGAYVPNTLDKSSNQLSCYGILYSRNDLRCTSCGLRKSCRVKADNLGLLEITLSPELLGAQGTRIPHIEAKGSNRPVDKSVRDMEILVHLDESFQRSEQNGKLFWSGANHKLFQAQSDQHGLVVRFIGKIPGPALRQRLTHEGKIWYAPSSLSTQETISLIDQHGRESVVHA
jgi:hypothetical protein